MIPKPRKSKKGFYQTVFFSVFLLLLFLAVIGFLVFSNWRIIQKRTELTAKIEALKKEIQILEEKNVNLKAGISQLSQESYWEEKIREQGYKKPGEEVVAIKKIITKEEKEIKEEENFLEKTSKTVLGSFSTIARKVVKFLGKLKFW